ncbi:unnamed protein product [Candida verbasci]|uniref:mRNA export factor GLE1 n=1 Tax=Candida verbasci TaxID=1227364 RepID=A0A9W4TVN0_9ASCO|nr:unnamed protein product [Candida verbasci]
MRFGLPADYEVELVKEVKNDIVIKSIEVEEKEEEKLPLVTIPSHDKSMQPLNVKNLILESQFNDIYEQIKNYTIEVFNQNQLLDEIEYQKLHNKLTRNQQLEESNINALINSFSNILSLQNDEVNNIILKHKERIKREEESKRRLEEERRRMEEEKRKQRELEIKKQKEEELRRIEEQKRIANEEQERKRKEEEAKIKTQQERDLKLKQELENKKRQEAGKLNFTNYDNIEKQFLKYKQDIIDIKTNVVSKLNEDKELKKQLMPFKRKLNPKFGQLSNSQSQLNKITNEVLSMIELTKSNELIFKWILNFIAKAIIDQAETEVIVRSFAAIPLAHLAYSILAKFPEFEYFLTARFIKKCPYIIGFTSSIDSEQGRSNMGYKRNKDDNKWEDTTKYDERMSGIITVWSVMSRIHDENQIGIYSYDSTWKFLARILNLSNELLTNTHFALLGNWWEATAVEFLNRFGKQGQKICELVVFDLTNSVANKSFPSAQRVKIMGEDWLQNRKIETLKRMEL